MEMLKNIKKTSIISNISIKFKKKLSKNDQLFKNYIIKKLIQNNKRELKLSSNYLEKIIKLQHGENTEQFLKKFCEKSIEVMFEEKKQMKKFYFVIISSYFWEGENFFLTIGEEFFNIFCNREYKYNFLNLNALLSFANKATQNLFIFLQRNSSTNVVEVSLSELKDILEVDDGYSRFYDLEKNILLPALKDINLFFNNKITYNKVRESSFINSKINKIEFSFNLHYNEKISKLFPLIEKFSNLEELKNILLKASINYDYNYLKRNLNYILLHQQLYDNLEEALSRGIFYNFSETFFRNELIKLQKYNKLIYKESNFYESLDKFREEIFKYIKLYNIENILLILNIVKISMNIFSQVYKNNEILKNPIYSNFFYDLEKKGWCSFENENYIIIAEFNSHLCESYFAILKKG